MTAPHTNLSAPQSALAFLECPKCGRRLDADVIAQLCPCGSPLLARYDLEKIKSSLAKQDLAARPLDLWRYAELLPLRSLSNVISLGEKQTSIVGAPRTGRAVGIDKLYIKDEGSLPTGTFKARGAAIGLSRARELGVRAFAMPTNGNAGAAWAAYAARAGIEAHIFMPRAAPRINRMECRITGAHVRFVEGLIGDAGRAATEFLQKHKFYDASTLKEPYRIEGKKTLGFELAEQFDGILPDVIVYPTGGGVGLIGMHKAFTELSQIGWLQRRMPRLVAVQASGCAPIVRAWDQRARESTPWEDASTIALGINVPKAIGDFLILEVLRDSGGTALAVDDDAMLRAQCQLAANDGLFICLEGAATVAAARSLRESGWIRADDRVLLINTGTGLKSYATQRRRMKPGGRRPSMNR